MYSVLSPQRDRKTRPHTQHTMILIQNMIQFIYGFIRLFKLSFRTIHSKFACTPRGQLVRTTCLAVILGYIASHWLQTHNHNSGKVWFVCFFCGAGDSAARCRIHCSTQRGKRETLDMIHRTRSRCERALTPHFATFTASRARHVSLTPWQCLFGSHTYVVP